MKSTLLLCLLFSAIYSNAQIKAVTNSGDEVILMDNGTWKYTNENSADEKEKQIRTNLSVFTKSKDATFQVKSKIINAEINLNPKKWSFKKSPSDEASEYKFDYKEHDAYAMLIVEKIEVPLMNLKKLALDNAKTVAPDTEVVDEEYRMVNGRKVLCMQMNGTIEGIKFTYLGYYYSYEGGTIQFLTYTAQNLLKDYKPDLIDFLNGLVVH